MENSQKISEIFRYFLEPIFKKKTVKKETISNTFEEKHFSMKMTTTMQVWKNFNEI